eukprot:scaffold30.g4465.t1
MEVGAQPNHAGVAECIDSMAAAVQAGAFAQAERLGREAPVNLAIPKAAIRLGAPIAETAQASVSRGELAPADGGMPRPVAVKRPRIRETLDLERCRREVALLAELRHPNIVGLVGARLIPPADYQVLLELEHTNAAHELHHVGWRPDLAQLLSLAAQLADAVAHMHAAGYVHRDIKPANILLDAGRRRVRLADMGVASSIASLNGALLHPKPTGGFHKQHMVGTLEYMAPEVLLKEEQSTASDVFALAVTLSELASGVMPYSDCTRDNPLAHTILEMGYGRQELAAAMATDGLRPTLPADMPPELRGLLEACWQREPSLRLSAAGVAARLRALAAGAEPAPDSAMCAGPFDAPGGERQQQQRTQGKQQQPPQQQQPGPEHVPVQGASTVASCELRAPAPGDAAAGVDVPGGGDSSAPRWLEAAAEAATPEALQAHRALAVGAFATPGTRGAERMEDRHLALADASSGADAAFFLQRELPAHLCRRLPGSRSGRELLASALQDADAAFRAQADAEWEERVARMGAAAAGRRPYPGSTATIALLLPGRVVTANLGDSRAVLCRGGQAMALTQDQTAEREDERARVAAAGGAPAVRAGTWRVGAAGLAVTRSVGDADLKGWGVVAEAETAELGLRPGEDAFVVVATDGLWDTMSNEEVVALVKDTVKHPGMCAQRLVTEALARGSEDNVSAVVAMLSGSTADVPLAEAQIARWTFQFTATSNLQHLSRQQSQQLVQSACQAAGGSSARCSFTLQSPAASRPSTGLALGGQVVLTISFDAEDGNIVQRRYLPPSLPPAAGRPFSGLRSNGSRVLRPDGRPWTGWGVNVVDDYKCGVCQGSNALSQAETLRRLRIAAQCLGAQWDARTSAYDPKSPSSYYKETVTFTNNPQRLAVLDAAVQLAGQLGIYIEIALWNSWALTNPANPGPAGTAYGWPTAATADFWRVIAARYANVSHVFFGLLNEPQDNSDGSLDAAYTASPLVNAVRSTGAQNLVAVAASRAWARYADGFAAFPIADINWAAAIHPYLHPAEFDAGMLYCRTHACVVEEMGPVPDFGYTLSESQQEIAYLKAMDLPSASWIADEDCVPQMLYTTQPAWDSCWDNRPLRLTAWGAAMRDAMGEPITCALLA